MLRDIQLAYRHWLREILRGDWTMTLLSLILAVTAISSIQFITNRIEQGLTEQSAKLLGGNLAIQSTYPIPDKWLQMAQKHQLRSATVIDTQTMLNINNQFVLVSLQAVSKNYPLFGTKLSISDKQTLADRRLINQFNLTLPIAIKLGKTNFQVSSLVPADLELTFTSWLLGPRVIIRIEDLENTKINVPGSRAIYRLLLAGEQQNISAFTAEIKQFLTPQQRVSSANQQRFALLNSLNQIDQYLQLVILFCILMCGVAIVLSMQQYVKKHYKVIALWCFLGAKQTQIRRMYLLKLSFTAVIAGLIGTLIGYLLHLNLLPQLTSYFKIDLPTPTIRTYITGLISSVILLFCASFPVFENLLHVQALALWRAETSSGSRRLFWPLTTLITFIVFLLWMMHFSLFSLFAIDCLFFTIALFIFLIDLIFGLIKRFAANKTGAIKRGLSQINQHSQTSALQIGAFSLVIMLMLVISTLKMNILDKWRDAIKNEAPNYFAFNMTQDDLPMMRKILDKYQVRTTQFYPMIKGRLTTLNGKSILANKQPGNLHNALHRDLFLTSSMHFPDDNKIINGSKWTAKDRGKRLVSVEASLAEAISAAPGDKLGFMVNGSLLEATISNIRTVDWASMNPNFYIIFPADTFKSIPATHIVSFYLPNNAGKLVSDIVRQMPNVTVIDMADTLQKIQSWVNQAATAIQGLFVFSLLASIFVMLASTITTMDERRETARLTRLLGGTRTFILKSLITELIVIITLSLLIGSGGSILISKAILWFF